MAGTILGLNPTKKFPEFDGYSVFMNEQLEGTMDEDSLTSRQLGKVAKDYSKMLDFLSLHEISIGLSQFPTVSFYGI